MTLAIFRGHRKCASESVKIIKLITDGDEQRQWKESVNFHSSVASTLCAGIGMPHFVARNLRRQYNLEDMDILDQDIQKEFALREVDKVDKIYVNRQGDGLLHLAAGMGNMAALKHLVENYNPNVNLANQAKSETPLLSACRGGHLDCAVYLLDHGADVEGSEWADETPLYWLCSFSEDNIPTIAQKFLAGGVKLRNTAGQRRGERLTARTPWCDSDNMFSLPVSPLSRAVMMQSLPAVRTLLAMGADPLEDIQSFSSKCPLVMAAVLTLPRFLEVMLAFLDSRTPKLTRIFTDLEMLQIAVEKAATAVDPTSLHSRVSRCGGEYKIAMFETLQMLYLRDQKAAQWYTEGSEHRARAANTVLALMVSLGRVDIVDVLLQLGHSVHGTPGACPIIEAVKLNHEPLFRLLVGHGADVTKKVSGPNGAQLSLLQVAADRPSQSRPGLFIAEYLLRVGIPVDPLPDGTRSAFALAVLNQDFELAEVLLRHGADIDFTYRLHDRKAPITVFAELVRNPTEKNVESVRYLLGIGLGKSTTGISLSPLSGLDALQAIPLERESPDFIVDKTNNLSVLHFCAIFPPQSNLESLAMEIMMADILSKKDYSNTEAINLVHPSIGTALWAATIRCNVEVACALLDAKADAAEPFGGFTPIEVALLMIERVLSDIAVEKTARMKALKRYTRIVERLRQESAAVRDITEVGG